MIPPPRITTASFTAIHNVRSSLPRVIWEECLLENRTYETPKDYQGLRLSAGTTHHVEIQAEHHVTAMLSFIFQRPQSGGSTLQITYSECYEDMPEYIPYIRKKGDRCDITKQLLGPEDKYIFSGEPGAQSALELAYMADAANYELFSPFHFRTLRFISLDIVVASDSDLILSGIEMNATNYPLDVTGSFEISDTTPLSNTYQSMWANSVRTLVNCMHDSYQDCPFYEQLQYAMDVRSSCLFTYAISSDDRMARQAIVQLHHSYRPELGLIASRSPAHQLQVIPHFSLFWICTVTDHFEHFGNAEFIRRFVPACDGVLESFAHRIDPRLGLIASGTEHLRTTWDFVDWTKEWKPMGIPPAADRTGFQAFTNLLYAYTLQNLAKVVFQLGRPALGQDYESRAHKILEAVRKQFWDGSAFTDGLSKLSDRKHDLSQHIQIWSVLSGAIEGPEARELLCRCLASSQPIYESPNMEAVPSSDDIGFTVTSTAMSFYMLRAMSKVGGTLYDDAFHAFWDPWRSQLSQNLTTWCEDDVTLRSDCHAWSATPLYEFMAEVAGVKPAEPGWKAIAFKRRVRLFPNFSARVPLGGASKARVAQVAWSREADESSVRVTLSLEHVLEETVAFHVEFPDGHVEKHFGPLVSVVFQL